MMAVRTTWGAASFLDTDTCLVRFLLSDFEFNGRLQAVVRVLALRVAEELDVFEHVLPSFLPCFIAGRVALPPDAFSVR